MADTRRKSTGKASKKSVARRAPPKAAHRAPAKAKPHAAAATKAGTPAKKAKPASPAKRVAPQKKPVRVSAPQAAVPVAPAKKIPVPAAPAVKIFSPLQKPTPNGAASVGKALSPSPALSSAPVSVPPPPPVAPPRPPPPPRRALVTLTLVTRKSPLAMVQADLVLARFAEHIPDYAFRVLKLVTTGDRQEEWSLQQEGGKGLFTGELEMALRDFRADVAVHSAKDLPTDMPPGLALSGYLPREDPRDVLVVRETVTRPVTIATGSPRRRQQLERQFAKANFIEMRGNVETRLKRIVEGFADATVLAAAGLKRLGITEFPGLRFQQLPLAVCVPAVGQAAIAVQARSETANFLRPHLDAGTRRAVELERSFLRMMGGGCHTAFAAHYDGAAVHIFHETCGYQRFAVIPSEADEPDRVAERLLGTLKLKP